MPKEITGTKKVHLLVYEDDDKYIKIHYPMYGGRSEFMREAIREAVRKHKKAMR